MEYLEIVSPERFTEKIQKVEEEDYITAKLENEIKSALLNNDVFLKALAEAIQKKSNAHIENGSIHVTSQDKQNWSGKAGTAVATQTENGLESAADKKKLDGIAAGAEVNQNAFSNVKVGNVTISANEKTATFTLAAGSNITIHADNATKQITITAERDGGNADKLDGYHAEHFAVADHGHDGRYYTKTESDHLLNQKAANNHNHNGGKYLAGQGIHGGYSFANDGAEDTGMFSDSDGDLYFMQNSVKWKASREGHTHNYLPTTGGTTGYLDIQPSSGEGGQLELKAASDSPTIAGIVIDNFYGIFRIFGRASADGKTKTGTGSTFSIDPYTNKVYAGTYDFEAHAIATRNLGDLDVAFDTGTSSGGYRTTITPAEIKTNSLRLSSKEGDALHLCTAFKGSTLYESDCQSVCFGYKAGNISHAKTFRDNVVLGYRAGEAYLTGAMDVIIGAFAAMDYLTCEPHNEDPNDDESFNVFIGGYAGESIKWGSETVCLGYEAGSGSSDNLLNCSLIGPCTCAFNSTNKVNNSTALGHSASVTGDNQVQLGDHGTSVYAYSALNNRSDRRDKTDIRDTQLGLEFLLKHRPVEFRWDFREAYQDRVEKEVKKVRVVRNEVGEEKEEEYREKEVEFVSVPKDGSRAGKRFHEGFIAQEVEAILEEMGVDFAGLQNHNISGGADRYTIGYTEYIPILVKALKELKQIYDKKIKRYDRKIKSLEERMVKLEKFIGQKAE